MADYYDIEATMRAVLKIRLDEELDGRLLELQTCDRHERAERVRTALRLQVALMAYERRGRLRVPVPDTSGFMTPDEVFIAAC
ncbi:MAG: hypothetical protein ACI80V_002956 [Rhodothermales bacterium]|jgi:hypothetical protein